MAKQVNGICSICGTQGPLTKEHVPPRSAFNKGTLSTYTLEAQAITDTGQIQGGMSAFSLCEKCNNDTGGWYGREYVNWTREADSLLQKTPVTAVNATLDLSNVYPLRFLKQAVVMMFSACNTKLAPHLPDLKNFVLDPQDQNTPARYRLFIMLYRNGPSRRYAQVTPGKQEQILPGVTFFKTQGYIYEIAHFPFAIYMIQDFQDELRPSGYKMHEITNFINYGYDQTDSLQLLLPIVTANNTMTLLGMFQ